MARRNFAAGLLVYLSAASVPVGTLPNIMLGTSLSPAPGPAAAGRMLLPLKSDDEPHFSPPLEYDCPLKELALAHSLGLLANSSRHRRSATWPTIVYDSLQLGPLCRVPPPVERPAPPMMPPPDLPPDAVYVSTSGHDSTGDGSVASPFASLRRAVLQTRITAGSRTVVARGGHYFLNETLTLEAADSGLSIVAHPGEEPVLHGGVALAGLDWAPAGAPFPAAVRVASVAHLPLKSWDSMVTDGKLLWRARFPDVPEFGRQLQPDGYVPVYTFTNRGVPQADGAAALTTSSLPCRSNSSFACHSETIGGNSEKFENRRGYCGDKKCDMGAASVTPAASGNMKANAWAHPETGVAHYLVGPAPTCVWWNSGSFITGVTNVSGPGPRRLSPYINVSGFTLRPERMGVGAALPLKFNCTKTATPTECVEQAAKHCLALGDSCGGFSYAAMAGIPPIYPAFFAGGGSNITATGCGNTDWNVWCKPGRCGSHCPAEPFAPQISKLPGPTLTLGDGDWQAAVSPGAVVVMPNALSMMYVENIMEELTAPGEWFLDAPNQKLYLFPNGTLDEKTQLVASTLTTLIAVRGDRTTPATDITLSGLTISSTRPTFMRRYSVVSEGDWAIYRGGAVTASHTVRCIVELCTFRSLGGNGLMLNGRNFGTVIRHNEFFDIGDSAMAAVGDTRGVDGYSKPRSANFTSVIGNLVHEIGLIGKQVAGWGQMLAANTLLENNVMFNMPRAAINL